MGAVELSLDLSEGSRFIDVWFDNIFTDLEVRDRIKQARANVDRSIQLVADLRTRLDQRLATATGALAAAESERQETLAA